ncbi:MAG TPA: hypothetical protein PKD85_06925, partial [Saprospiraceae bacterium]|nr:hypothetical protein [Saprospiraceae bacterium]
MKSLHILSSLLSIILIIGSISSVDAQSFGRNKPRYRNFDFKVLETKNYELHYYCKNREKVNQFAQWAELWYDFHKSALGEEFSKKSPLILYNTHGDFQQTNTTSGSIGIGTGGFTEAFKNRVVMPFSFSNQQTYYILGHELVHAFQFNSILNGDSTNLQSLGNLDLFLVEGMAEYMSLGSVDPFTSMWMRDAIIQNKIPSIKEMRNPKYFPYRWGQALFSTFTSIYGDQYIKPLFKYSAIYGLELAIPAVFEISMDNLSALWVDALTKHYTPYLRDKKEKPQGSKIFSTNTGNINISPSVSPDGKYIVFLSEKDIFSVDLFLADLRTGKIMNKVTSSIRDSDIDNLDFLESAGSWSPNGNDFVYVAYKKGKNILVLKDADRGKTTAQYEVKGLEAISNPVFHPNGRSIVMTGMKEGQTDLFSYELRTGRVTQLTNDIYAELLPSFNRDGSKLAFSYDKRSIVEGQKNNHWTLDIAVMDVGSTAIEILDVFHGAENLNPTFDHEDNILFVSERDGFRNLYKYVWGTEEVLQLTDLLTGISGIGRLSPCISASQKRDKVVYTHYFDNKYVLYEASSKDFINKVVDPKIVNQAAGTLPIEKRRPMDIVNKNLKTADQQPLVSEGSFRNKQYKPRFKLDYMGGGTGIGVGTSNFGTMTGLMGGVDMVFSDMLGNNQMFGTVSANGEITDFAGQLSYINRKNRLAWGVGMTHVPFRTGFQNIDVQVLDLGFGPENIVINELNIIRIFDQTASAFVHYPFSTTMRFEAAATGGFRSFSNTLYNNYYRPLGFNQYQFVGEQRERLPIGDTLQFASNYRLVKGPSASVSAGFVGDNSFFGMTAPLAGYRWRISADKFWGAADYASITVDGRRYMRKKPFTLATRFTSNMRFENRTNSVIPYYVGQMGFVRGYGTVFNNLQITQFGQEFDELIGSKLAVASVE